MSGNKLLLDTNTVLYFLEGDQTLGNFLNDKELYLSIITEIELFSFNNMSPGEVQIVNSFLKATRVVSITEEIKKHSIEIRRKYRYKLPDCIIAATSIAMNISLVTSDKQLTKLEEVDVIFYQR